MVWGIQDGGHGGQDGGHGGQDGWFVVQAHGGTELEFTVQTLLYFYLRFV